MAACWLQEQDLVPQVVIRLALGRYLYVLWTLTDEMQVWLG